MTQNERERAQFDRVEEAAQDETAVMLAQVVARDELGRVTQVRRLREATPEEAVQLWLAKGAAAHEVPWR